MSDEQMVRCKKRIMRYIGNWPSSGACTRLASKDGYCKQHHPDAVKARKDAAQARFDAKSALRRAAFEKTGGLERELAEARAEMKRMQANIEESRGLIDRAIGAMEVTHIVTRPRSLRVLAHECRAFLLAKHKEDKP